MWITVHSCTDQLNQFPTENKYFGIGDVGYTQAMKWLNDHQEYRGGERYEYFGGVEEILFMWEMTQDNLRHLRYDKDWHPSDYCGSLFFGNYKMEFIWDPDIQCRINCFEYDPADGGREYGDINGVSYDRCDPIESSFLLPPRRSLERFTKAVEEKIIDILNKHPDLIEQAIKPTRPDIWYVDSFVHPTINMIH